MTIINDLSYIMVTINCSVNFIIYCFLGESFRKEMKKMAEESREQFQKWLLKVFWKMRNENLSFTVLVQSDW